MPEVLRKAASCVNAEDSDEMLLKAAQRAADESFERRQSAGVNPAHRSVVLAMQPGIDLASLAAAAVAEARLTHRHGEALATAAAVALLARQVLTGEGISAACRGCLPYLHDFDAPETSRVLRRFSAWNEADDPPQPTHREGFSPLVLESALSFEDALHDSLEFAGPDNFCPVLVGSLGGALFGCDMDLESLADEDVPDVPDVPGPAGAGVTWRTLNHQHFLPVEHRKRIGGVAKVLDVCSSEVYALKLQRRDSTTKFAIREAEALHRSSHAFIVRLIHIFQTQSYYALLMELCDKSLNACILDSLDENGQIGGLADYPTKRYAACITLALEYLHQQRVVFRDLKPDNVLVTFKDNVAKLADFGLARSLTLDSAVEARGSEESGSDRLSPKVSSTVCGTPRFMAPEVYDELMLVDSDDEEDAIKRLLSRDWYALGCCLLLMLLGQEAGSLAEANGRRVLLPPSGQAEITCSLRKASKKGRIDEDALHLIDSLTAPVEVRFDASDLRRQPFLEQVIVEMEQFASA
eukprot:s1824_g5.t1